MSIARHDSDKKDIWTRLAETKDSWAYVSDYRERLDAVVPGEWDCTLKVVNDDTGRIVYKCRVQILGVIRESVSDDRTATHRDAEQSAFKNACAMFGLGQLTQPQT